MAAGGGKLAVSFRMNALVCRSSGGLHDWKRPLAFPPPGACCCCSSRLESDFAPVSSETDVCGCVLTTGRTGPSWAVPHETPSPAVVDRREKPQRQSSPVRFGLMRRRAETEKHPPTLASVIDG